MPFTPFHLGPALLLGMLFFKRINFPTFLIASVIVDIEPFFIILLGLDSPLHGFFHSYLGGSVLALAVYFVMLRADEKIQNVMKLFNLGQKFSKKSIFAASFFGVHFHVFLDSFLYADMKPLLLSAANHFYGAVGIFEIYAFCVFSFIAGSVLLAYKIMKKS